MNKSAKPLIVKIILLLVIVTSIVLVSTGLRFKYEALKREKSDVNNMLKKERTKKVNLIAEYQSFSSDERIVLFAEEKLDLKKLTDPKITITVNNNDINQLNSELKRKYE